MPDKKILIVDDDPRNVFALSAVLKAKGFNVLKALGMHEAFAILEKQHDVKVILLDMMMPDMDGYQAIPLLKANADIAFIPVIAVTAQAMVGDKERCLEAGADGYVSKPIDAHELLAQINQYV
jgi:CheY-like chemotaxis protein